MSTLVPKGSARLLWTSGQCSPKRRIGDSQSVEVKYEPVDQVYGRVLRLTIEHFQLFSHGR